MKIVFIGCVQFSFLLLRHLLNVKGKDVDIVGVVTRKQSSFNSDFVSLEVLAKKNHIPYFCAEGNDQKSMLAWLQEKHPDVIYCFGWSYLLEKSILQLPRLGVVGYHPTLLPKHRGRHPIVWALALGLDQTGSTFFQMDEGADSGPILSQEVVGISKQDDAKSLYEKLVEQACKQVSVFTPQLLSGRYELLKQDESQASYWRKRGKSDGEINWNKPAKEIYNLVRALTHPYVGAHFVFQGREYKVWKSQVVPDERIGSVGIILDANEQSIIVKCGGGNIQLYGAAYAPDMKRGDSLFQG